MSLIPAAPGQEDRLADSLFGAFIMTGFTDAAFSVSPVFAGPLSLSKVGEPNLTA